MLNVACVKVGTRYGADYVNTLFDMVRRNLPAGHAGRFVCFTDDAAGLDPAIQVRSVPKELATRGWWAKLYLFSEDAFPKGERVLYFDLDTAITGPLDAIAAYKGDFAILRDVYRMGGLQSSAMAWKAGFLTRVYKSWLIAGSPDWEGGDQAWIERAIDAPDILQDLFPGRFRSYKVECRASIPSGTSVVFFHGKPRPHEVTSGWVPEVWKIGGGSGLEFVVQSNVDDRTLLRQVQETLKRECKWLAPVPRHEGTALIVGGGPSLEDTLFYIRGMKLNGCTVFATNNTYRYLKEHGIQPDAHVMIDARAENLDFVPDDPVPKLYASQCHPKVLDSAGKDLICWHAYMPSYRDHIAHHASSAVQIGGGSTVGLRTVALAYALGYREFRLFGFDSSYRESHHAYPQALNDQERQVECKVNGKTFRCAPWMIAQAEEFKELSNALVTNECVISVYGDGLLPQIASQLSKVAADERAEAILKHIAHLESPTGAEIGVYMGALSKRLLRNREDLKLYLVDCWQPQDGSYKESEDFHAEMGRQEHEKAYETALKSIAAFDGRAFVMRQWSQEAAQHVPDHGLDFVFIDANHSYEGCRQDLELWAPKVRPGGVIAGHDYAHPEYPQWGVERAVNEFAQAKGLKVQTDLNYTWFIHLPTESRVH